MESESGANYSQRLEKKKIGPARRGTWLSDSGASQRYDKSIATPPNNSRNSSLTSVPRNSRKGRIGQKPRPRRYLVGMGQARNRCLRSPLPFDSFPGYIRDNNNRRRRRRRSARKAETFPFLSPLFLFLSSLSFDV